MKLCNGVSNGCPFFFFFEDSRDWRFGRRQPERRENITDREELQQSPEGKEQSQTLSPRKLRNAASQLELAPVFPRFPRAPS